jgi:hypothetical protein
MSATRLFFKQNAVGSRIVTFVRAVGRESTTSHRIPAEVGSEVLVNDGFFACNAY